MKLISSALLLIAIYVSLVLATEIHEPGYCSLYGQCGKKSLFGKDLPCEANVKASVPTSEEALLLKEICGWEDQELVCCNEEQLRSLKEQTSKVMPIIASCPACKENFYQFFCHFTCSPDQSTFINVTKTDVSTVGKTVVTELDDYVLGDYASKFFDSCKNIKFSLTNGYAMDLIGGGAKTYQEFLKFLGDEKPMLGGSPFQINYKYETNDSDMTLLNNTAYDCNYAVYRCACPDCQDACPAIPDIVESNQCHVGILPCFSFSVIIIYTLLLVLSCWVVYYKNKNNVSPLLVDSYLDTTGEDSSDEYEVAALERRTSLLNDYLESKFGALGFYCALFPKTIISITLVATLIMSSFMAKIQLETNPVNLWVSPDAELYKQKIHFDENFGPFYRTQQIFLVNETGPILQNYDTLKFWFAKEKEITNIVVAGDNKTDIVLSDICFQPTGDVCIIESFTQYFHGDFLSFPNQDQYLSKLKSCIDSPVTCLPDFQQPLNKNLLFGGFDENLGDDALDATAIVVTILLNNDVDEDSKQVEDSSKWELLLESYLLELQLYIDANFTDLRLSFNTESSLEKELNKSTNTDIRIIVLSYLVMFAYASLALGGKLPGTTLKSWTTTKFSLGLIGIFIVLLSVASSAGICALFGIKSTLIIAEVIPFLVLAVGVDNIFLITNEFKKCSLELPQNMLIEEKIGLTLGKIGPSILISSSSQFLCFSLASVVSMPAVRNFAIYCAGAVLINAVLQITCFISVLSLDERRYQDNRLDILPFIKVDDSSSSSSNLIIPQLLKDDELENHFFHRLMKNYYAPLILKNKVKPYIIGAFILWFGFSLSLLPTISLGLDQRIAIPSDSFLIEYFNDIYQYLNVGPPIYFVVDNLNLTETENQQRICGKFAGCNQFSLGNVLEQEYNKENKIISEPLSSWLDDYFLWLNPDMDQCCRVKKLNNDEFCLPNAPARPCQPCYQDKDYDYANITSFPHGEEFLKYYSNWIDSPSDPCPLGGKAPYSTSIKPDFDGNTIKSSVFRTSHLALRSQEDFINAYEDLIKLCDMIKDLTDIEELYAYSPFYIFFMQYATIINLAFELIGIALIFILVVSTILLSSFRVALILVVTVVMIMVDIGGFMVLWGISLNAVSLVNLVICIGIAVEFCVHLARGYMFIDKHVEVLSVKKESVKRAYQTLTNIGGSVFGGITMTKLIGVMVLAFTRSKIFEIYYFRMWLSLIIVLSLHSLMFLPVVLSYIGGNGYYLNQNGLIVGDDLLSRLRSSYDDD